MKPKFKVLLDVYLDCNIGDDLMIKIFAENFEDCEFYLLTSNQLLLRAFLENKNIKIIDTVSKDLRNSIDIYLTLGGSVFQIKGTLEQLGRIKKIIKLLIYRLNGKKVVTIGCNIGPLVGRLSKLIAYLELKLNNLVTVRDLNSYALLKEWKIRNLKYGQDLVLNLKFKSIVQNRKNILGISAYRSTTNPDINLDLYKKIAEVSNFYISETNNEVRLFAFDTESENDISACDNIRNLIVKKDKVSIVSYLGDINYFIDQINQCSIFISIRFHSLILCSLLKIPFFPISYSMKTTTILNDHEYKRKIYTVEEFINTPINESIEMFVNSFEGIDLTNQSKDYETHISSFRGLLNNLID